MFGCGNVCDRVRFGTLGADVPWSVRRPWSDLPIVECGEPLVSLEPGVRCLRPHPYASLGAPYGPGVDPFVLRRGVAERLMAAEQDLIRRDASLRFAIFDAWRPVAVQDFMVQHAIRSECERLGLVPEGVEDAPHHRRALEQVKRSVARFWAPPSLDRSTPPPHSTGAAFDLTLADRSGSLLDMGGEIDAIGPVSEPEFYAREAALGGKRMAEIYANRRQLLAEVLTAQAFVRHPNEWWHFSFGDQLWAWSRQHTQAVYGRIDQPD